MGTTGRILDPEQMGSEEVEWLLDLMEDWANDPRAIESRIDILEDIRTKRVQVWNLNNGDGICITRVCNYALNKVLAVEWLKGKGLGIFNCLDILEQFAEDQGCNVLEYASARKAFERLNKKAGFHKDLTIYRKWLK